MLAYRAREDPNKANRDRHNNFSSVRYAQRIERRIEDRFKPSSDRLM